MADLKNKLSYGSKGTVASVNATGGVEIATPEVKTAQAQKTEQDQSVMNAVQEPVERPIAGYKEVEDADGNIEMVPVYEDDWSDED